MAKKDPVALLLDNGARSATSLTRDVRSNLNISEPLPGESQTMSSVRNIASAVEEISPMAAFMESLGEKGIPINPPGQGEGIKAQFTEGEEGPWENFPAPPGLDKAPQFVEDIIPDFLKQQENQLYGTRQANRSSNNTDRERTEDKEQKRTQAKDLFELEPY